MEEENKNIEAEEPTEILGNTGVIEPVVEEPVTETAPEAPVEPAVEPDAPAVEETPAPEPAPEAPVVEEAPTPEVAPEAAPEAPSEPVAEAPVEPAVETQPAEQPVEPAPVIEPAAPTEPKKKSKLPLILLLILVLAAGGFAVWYFVLGGNGSKKEEPKDEPIVEPEPEPEPTDKEDVPAKTEEQIKKLYEDVFEASEGNLTSIYTKSQGTGSFYQNGMQKLFDKVKVQFSSLNLDDNGKFEFAIHSKNTAEIYQIRDSYESMFGGSTFEIKEYTIDGGLFKCGHDEVVYTCVTEAAVGGEGSAEGTFVKYASFTQDGKTIEMTLYAVKGVGDEVYSIKDGSKIELADANESITAEANRDVFSKYTYKATFEIDGTGYKFISVEPTY